jgi:hypothetical protein
VSFTHDRQFNSLSSATATLNKQVPYNLGVGYISSNKHIHFVTFTVNGFVGYPDIIMAAAFYVDMEYQKDMIVIFVY